MYVLEWTRCERKLGSHKLDATLFELYVEKWQEEQQLLAEMHVRGYGEVKGASAVLVRAQLLF